MFTKCDWLICLLSLFYLFRKPGQSSLEIPTVWILWCPLTPLTGLCPVNWMLDLRLDQIQVRVVVFCCVLFWQDFFISAVCTLPSGASVCVSSPWRSMPRSRHSSEAAESWLSHSVTSSRINWNSSIIRHFLFLPLGTQWYSSFRKGEDLTYLIYLKYLIFN